MSEENKNTDTRSASQRLTDLENNLGQLSLLSDYINKDLSIMKSAVKLIDNKLNALIKATTQGETVTDEVIDRIMVENNVEDLTNKVSNMVTQGIISPEQTVSENSFVVGKEADAEGKVSNPRVQFVLMTLNPEIRTQFVGAKVGDALTFQDGKLVFTILESYKINEAPTSAPSEPAVPVTDPTTTPTTPTEPGTAS